MRLFNWRRQAVLNAMPLVKPDQVRTPWHEFWRRFRRQHMAMTAALFVILLIVVAIFARWIAPYDAENYFDYDNLNNGPSLQHWFGVDSLGRDIFSRVLVGAQISLAAGVFAVFIGAAIGTLLGLLAGYYEGWWDRLIMRICDVLFAFPGILLAIARISGETAPLLFTALNNQFWSSDMNAPMANLPIVIFQFAMSPYEDWHTLAWAGALLITFSVLTLNILARWFGSQQNQSH